MGKADAATLSHLDSDSGGDPDEARFSARGGTRVREQRPYGNSLSGNERCLRGGTRKFWRCVVDRIWLNP